MVVGLILLGACPEWAGAQTPVPPGQTAAPFTPRKRIDPFEQFRKSGPLPAPVVAAEQAWRVTLGVLPTAGGAMDEARVYIPMQDALLIALDRETGVLQWIREINTAVPPIVADGTVYVAAHDGIRALDAVTGKDRWQTPLTAKIAAPMTWDTGWLIAMVEPGDVVAMRAADGEILWRRPLGAVSPHPAVPGGQRAIYFSLADGRLVALSLTDGAVLWEQKVPGVLSEPATARDRVFVGSTNNFFYAFDDDSGTLEWKWQAGGDVIGAASEGDVVYFASLDNVLKAVNRGNGNQRWKKESGTRPVLPPRAFAGTVVVPGMMPAITAFVGRTGEAMGTYAASGYLIGPPLIDTTLDPMRVSFVTITREGVVEAMRSTGLTLREAAGTPMTALPGRQVARERAPE